MGRKGAEAAVAQLLDEYQAVLDDVARRYGYGDDPSRRRFAELSEEDWLLWDSSMARIDAVCQVLELLGYRVARSADGFWVVRRCWLNRAV